VAAYDDVVDVVVFDVLDDGLDRPAHLDHPLDRPAVRRGQALQVVEEFLGGRLPPFEPLLRGEGEGGTPCVVRVPGIDDVQEDDLGLGELVAENY